MKVIDVEVMTSELFGAGGYVQLRRLQVRNRREDGSSSPAYALDAVERPGRTDAVVVLAFERSGAAQRRGRSCEAAATSERTGAGVRVLLRRGLRPVPRLGRGGEPTREGVALPVETIEAVAGLLEPHDVGEAGLCRRAAEELLEETGLHVDGSQVRRLGPAVLLSPGVMAERIYPCCVEAPLAGHGAGAGDGSLLEEGGGGLCLLLAEALERCRRGLIADAKTELALRRLAEQLDAEARVDEV